MAILNLTPHMINIVWDGGKMDIAPSGIVARCSQSEIVVGDVEGIPLTQQQFGEVVDLPSAQPGVTLVVSRLVAAACPDREDLVIPGPLVRGEDGRPIGCKGLSKI